MPKESLRGYFNSREEAEHAANRLRALGVAGVQIERSGGARPTRGMLGDVVDRLTASIPGLGDLMGGAGRERGDNDLTTGGGAPGDVDEAGDAGNEGDTGRGNVILRAEVDEFLRDKAVQVIEESGGRV
jgi:hypothetical protein